MIMYVNNGLDPMIILQEGVADFGDVPHPLAVLDLLTGGKLLCPFAVQDQRPSDVQLLLFVFFSFQSKMESYPLSQRKKSSLWEFPNMVLK